MNTSKIDQIKTSKHLAYAVKIAALHRSNYQHIFSAKGRKYEVTITETFSKNGKLVEAKYEVRGIKTGQIAFFENKKLRAAA